MDGSARSQNFVTSQSIAEHFKPFDGFERRSVSSGLIVPSFFNPADYFNKSGPSRASSVLAICHQIDLPRAFNTAYAVRNSLVVAFELRHSKETEVSSGAF